MIRLYCRSPAIDRGPVQDLVEHRLGEPAGEGVLLARVVASRARPCTPPRCDLRAVAEPRARPRQRRCRAADRQPERRLPGEGAQRDDGPQPRAAAGRPRRSSQGAQVSRSAGRRLVGRWRAADGGDHPGAEQPLPVAGVRAGRLRRQAGPVQRGEQPVAAAVAGEDPAGPVAAVRGRRQPDDQQPALPGRPSRRSAGPSTARSANDRAPLDGDLLAPLHQPRAGAAHRDASRRGRPASPRREPVGVRRRATRDRGARVSGIVRPPGARWHRTAQRAQMRLRSRSTVRRHAASECSLSCTSGRVSLKNACDEPG